MLLVLCATNIFFGPVDIPVMDALKILSGESVAEHPSWYFIIIHSRVPQVLTALLCGAGLAASGLLLQTALRNPLAGPSILGVDSGANLAVAVVLMLMGGTMTVSGNSIGGHLLVICAAMLGALAVIAMLAMLSVRLKSPVMLLVAGVMISYIAGSLISLLQFGATRQGLQAFTFWGMGGFGSVTIERLPVFAILMFVGMIGAVLMIKPLDAMLLGDDYAHNLGVNVRLTHRLLFVLTGLILATTTAFCGPITFIGLATPHLARLLTGSSTHRILLPLTMLMGAVIALLCLQVCSLPQSGVLPVNVVTPLVGAPVVLWVVLRSKSSLD